MIKESRKVNVFLVGAAKSGTTYLANILNISDEISISELKEPHFFSKEFHLEKVAKYLDLVTTQKSYDFLFSKIDSKYIVDASTSYLAFPQSAQRIYEYNRNSKIIICLRNHVDRLYSHYRNNNSEGIDLRKFETVLHDFFENGNDEHLYFQYSCYSNSIENYTKVFGKENVLVLPFTLILDEKMLIDKISNFLGVNRWIIKKKQAKKNEKRIPSNRIIAALLKYPAIRSLYRKIISGKLRAFLRDNVLFSSDSSHSELKDSEKALLEKYFKNDAEEIRKKYGIKLS